MTLWKHDASLVLASTSATRLHLLTSIGLRVQTVAADVDERAIEARLSHDGASPDRIARELARAKAMAVAPRFSGRWIIGADQTLALGDNQFHKPTSLGQAAEQLRRLRGKSHQLHSAVVCIYDGVVRFEHVETAVMTMRPFSDRFLERYMMAAGDSATRSVGAYQAESLGLHLFDRIEGDHSTILGLPLVPLLAFLRSAGALEE